MFSVKKTPAVANGHGSMSLTRALVFRFALCWVKLSETRRAKKFCKLLKSVGAGVPERGLVLDRAKYFLGTLAARMSEEGCVVDFASKASPWQIAYVERAGGTWKTTFRRLVWAEQVSGREDVLVATGAINAARNNLARRSGFSPAQ